jgi:phage host-nuclease inhibitor protein Gam
MARKRIEGTALQNFAEVDEALQEIGGIDRELAMIEADQNECIDLIKAEAKQKAEPLNERKGSLERLMKEFCEAHRAEFAKTKTRELTFGSVGYRLSTRVIIKRMGDTLQALKDFGLLKCIRVKEEPDKEAMKELDAETLASIGAALKTDNVFGYTVKQEDLQEAA